MALETVTIALGVARGAAEQQRAIDAWFAEPDDARPAPSDGRARAILAEGAFFELVAPAGVGLIRLAAGCVCCVGWIPMRVHLQRAVRAGARSVLLLVASVEHLPRVRAMLQQPELGFGVRLVQAADSAPRPDDRP